MSQDFLLQIFFRESFSLKTEVENLAALSLLEPRNRFLAWRAGTTPLFDVPAPQATRLHTHKLAESIPWNRCLWLLKRLHIQLSKSQGNPPPLPPAAPPPPRRGVGAGGGH